MGTASSATALLVIHTNIESRIVTKIAREGAGFLNLIHSPCIDCKIFPGVSLITLVGKWHAYLTKLVLTGTLQINDSFVILEDQIRKESAA